VDDASPQAMMAESRRSTSPTLDILSEDSESAWMLKSTDVKPTLVSARSSR